MNLAELVAGHLEASRALHDGRDWITWGELRRRAASAAAELARLGVEPGERVGMALPNSPEFVAAYLGVLALGAVAVPLNPNSPAPELRSELASVRPRAVFAGGHAAAVIGDAVPEGTAVVGDVPDAPGPFAVEARADEDLAVLLFTSGTAGAPRAAALTHGNLLANLRQMLALPGEIARVDDVGLAAVPLFHVFGLNVALGLCLATGGGLVLEERFDPVASLTLVRDVGVTSVLGAPTMYAAWADAADAGADSSAMRAVRQAISGAAALPAEVAVRFEERFGIPVWQGYGLTEASPAVSTSLGTGRNRPGSVGRPLPGVEVRLVDDSGADALRGDPGEIWVRGDNVFAGYWDDPGATAEVLTGDGWLRTGDIGVLGDDDDLYVVDRRKDLVIVSGFNVFPAEVERVVAAIPGVADAVVVGRPDPVTGEAVEVVVVPRAGAALSEGDVRAACSASLARYKCPTSVRFVDELPRGLAGKALRRALREQQPA
ncbi:MAG: AMP-binding protein [Acidimicrobiales bacterium]